MAFNVLDHHHIGCQQYVSQIEGCHLCERNNQVTAVRPASFAPCPNNLPLLVPQCSSLPAAFDAILSCPLVWPLTLRIHAAFRALAPSDVRILHHLMSFNESTSFITRLGPVPLVCLQINSVASIIPSGTSPTPAQHVLRDLQGTPDDVMRIVSDVPMRIQYTISVPLSAITF